MQSPYKTKCFDYNKIGCKSRRDCVDRCNVEWAFKHCNGSLPSGTIIDRHNDKDVFKECNDNNKEFCEQKHKSPDCINEYYTVKLEFQTKIKELVSDEKIDEFLKLLNEALKSNIKTTKANINLMSGIDIYFNNEPDTIYAHSPQQYPIEFICLIGGVISLWTGFSVFSIYAYGKHVFNRKQDKIEVNVNSVNNKKIASINKKNDKISSLKNVMKMMKILKRKNQVIKVTPNNNV